MFRLFIQLEGAPPAEVELEDGTVRVGSGAECEVQVYHETVAAMHCAITVKEGALIIQDLGSEGGTIVDGQLVDEAPLRAGSVAMIGEVTIRVRNSGENFESAPSDRALHGVEAENAVAVAEPGEPGVCANHPEAGALYECTGCRRHFCERCVKHVMVAGKTVLFCLTCGTRCFAVGERRQAPAVAESESFWRLVPKAFGFPFRHGGYALLLGAGFLFGIIDVLANTFLGILGIVVAVISLFACLYVIAYLQEVVMNSAQGEDRLPDWPDVSGMWVEILQPAVKYVAATGFCFAPAIAAYYLASDLGVWLPIALGVLGVIYLPMAFLAVSLFDTMAGANPLVVLPAIMKVLGQYVVTCVLLAVLVVADWIALAVIRSAPIPFIPAFVATFVNVYFLVVEMHLLGLLYYCNREKLRWF